jgi:hypothetical protein
MKKDSKRIDLIAYLGHLFGVPVIGADSYTVFEDTSPEARESAVAWGAEGEHCVTFELDTGKVVMDTACMAVDNINRLVGYCVQHEIDYEFTR